MYVREACQRINNPPADMEYQEYQVQAKWATLLMSEEDKKL
jgi:hypothetical protein